MDQPDRAQLIIMALQQRIGEIVSNYETQVAVLRAEITTAAKDKEEQEKAMAEYSSSLSQATTK